MSYNGDEQDENPYEEYEQYGNNDDDAYDDKPRSTNVHNDELHEGGLMMMKLLMAQTHNEQKDDDEDELHHSQIETEELHRHVIHHTRRLVPVLKMPTRTTTNGVFNDCPQPTIKATHILSKPCWTRGQRRIS